MVHAPRSTTLWNTAAGASNTTIVLPPQDEAPTADLFTITIGIVGLLLSIATVTIAWRQYLQQRHLALPPARTTIALNDMAGQVPVTPSSPIQNHIRQVDHPSSETSLPTSNRTPDEHQRNDNQ